MYRLTHAIRTLLLVVVATWMALPAMAKESGIPVTVEVLDPDGNPIPTATVRHPEEQDKHRVSATDGQWTAKTLYLDGGKTIVFDKDMELTFEITAPGYVSATVRYIVRKRKNTIPVTLTPIDYDDDISEEDIPVRFDRDEPID